MIEVHVPPDLWDGGLEGVITTWLVDDGDVVTESAIIAELMGEKAVFSLEAPAAGRIRILVAPEVAIRPGQTIAHIDPSGA